MVSFLWLASFWSVFAQDADQYCSKNPLDKNIIRMPGYIWWNWKNVVWDADWFNNDNKICWNSATNTRGNLSVGFENFLKSIKEMKDVWDPNSFILDDIQKVNDYEVCRSVWRSKCLDMRDKVKEIQKIINRRCYRNTAEDWSIWVVTLNATQDCCYDPTIRWTIKNQDQFWKIIDISCWDGLEKIGICCVPKPPEPVKTVIESCRLPSNKSIEITQDNTKTPKCSIPCPEDCTTLEWEPNTENKTCNIKIIDNICEVSTDTEIKKTYDCKDNYVSLFVKNGPDCVKTCKWKVEDYIKSKYSKVIEYWQDFLDQMQKYINTESCCVETSRNNDPTLFSPICGKDASACQNIIGINTTYKKIIDDIMKATNIVDCKKPLPPCPIWSDRKYDWWCCFQTCTDGITIGNDCKKACQKDDPSDKCIEWFATLGMCTEVVVPPKPKCDPDKSCCGIDLNTDVPFIGNCIEFGAYNWKFGKADGKLYVNPLNAFPILIWSLSKIMVTVILMLSFISLIAAWVMMTNTSSFSKWKSLLQAVIIWLVVLWTVWIILKLINPNVF